MFNNKELNAMPQMAPMFWIGLYLSVLSLLLLTNIKVFFLK